MVCVFDPLRLVLLLLLLLLDLGLVAVLRGNDGRRVRMDWLRRMLREMTARGSTVVLRL